MSAESRNVFTAHSVERRAARPLGFLPSWARGSPPLPSPAVFVCLGTPFSISV